MSSADETADVGPDNQTPIALGIGFVDREPRGPAFASVSRVV